MMPSAGLEASMRCGLSCKSLAALLLLTVPLAVFAQTVLTLRTVNVRAGPDPVFPVVTWLHQSSDVHVVGCTEGWRWCDIIAGRTRGWVDASYLSGAFRNPRVPFVKFSVDSYWDEHYRNRPLYSSQSSWRDWASPSFRPPPP
jgi:uncharacterized protein YraI